MKAHFQIIISAKYEHRRPQNAWKSFESSRVKIFHAHAWRSRMHLRYFVYYYDIKQSRRVYARASVIDFHARAFKTFPSYETI